MKKRAKLNNRKLHFPLPLGEGRISTQGTSVRNSGEGKSFTKALSVAALAGLTFFGAQANAQEVIEGHFIDSPTAPANGAAINNPYNETIDNIDASFKNNYAKSIIHNEAEQAIGGTIANGGAIYNIGTVNGGTITEISGNYVEGYSGAQGGAIWNVSNTFKLDEVGDITDNHAIAAVAPAYGGAIYNTAAADFGKLNGAIKNNYVLSGKLDENGKVISGTGSVAYGGAIYNTAGGFTGGNVTEISGNYAESGSAPAYGGAIYNTSNAFKLDEIGDIINNHVYSPYAPAEGGAIYNEKGNLGEINGAIKDNYAISGTYDENGNLVSGAYAYGGAIYNANNGIVTGGTITEISGNYVEGNAGAYGGAIYNTTNSFKLDEVGDIKDNYARSNYCSLGGAIYNANGTIDGIVNSSFLNNYAEAKDGTAQGGAIYNTGKIGSLVVNNLTDNYIKAKGAYLYGGAIYNTGTVDSGSINLVKGNYILNTTSGTYNFGGAIYNTGVMNVDISNIIDNKITMSTSGIYAEGKGGAIYNTGTIKSLNGHILYNNIELLENGNSSRGGAGGAIYNSGTVNGGTLGNIIGNYINGSEACSIVGGAIYNYSNKFKIDAINGDIADNHVKGWNGAAGGAIYNYDGAFGDVTGNIYNNYSETVVFSTGSSGGLYSLGGAIYNTGTFGNITGNIYNNHAMDGVGGAGGGAIYNAGTMGNIKGDIAQNYTESNYSGWMPGGTGGAIFNGGTIGDISGNIIGNYTYVHRIEHHYPGGYGINGGAIYNYGKIGDITTNAVNNYIKIEEVYAAARTQGGFLHNSSYGTIKNIKGNFVGNYIDASPKEDANPNWSISYGGAISNEGKIERLDAEHFINNHTVSITKDADGNVIGGGSAMGGALYNKGTINGGKIGEISDNYAEGFIDTFGGAIYNNTENFKLDEIGNIVNNKVHSATTSAQGGAIWNSGGDLGKLNGAIVNNHARSIYGSMGGAIYNANGTIGEINGVLLNNYAIAATYDDAGNITNGAVAHGGAIWSAGRIGSITTNAINNYVEVFTLTDSQQVYGYGGAINNYGTIGSIEGLFQGNYVKATRGSNAATSAAYGGAIYNTAQIGADGNKGLDKVSFINNHVELLNSVNGYDNVYGGALYNVGAVHGGTLKDIVGNYAKGGRYTYGGAIYNQSQGFIIDGINGSIVNNYVEATDRDGYASGGAIFNGTGNLGVINSSIVNNHAIAENTANGGAITNTNNGVIEELNSAYVLNNYAESNINTSYGGAIFNTNGSRIGKLNISYLQDNHLVAHNAYGGAIANNNGASVNGGTIGEISGNYIEAYNAYGGAIWNNQTNFKLDAITGAIKNNYTKSSDSGACAGAIYNENGTIEKIVSPEISGNHSESLYNSFGGGAIYNTGTIGEFTTANLSNNHMLVGKVDEYGVFIAGGGIAHGGAIWNAGTINGGTIGDIKDNYALGYNGAMGGAIYNSSSNFKLDAITGNIIGNYAKQNINAGGNPVSGGAIYTTGGEIGEISTNKISNNYAEGYMALGGGAIYNTAKIGNITANEISNNYAKAAGNSSGPGTAGGFLYNSGTTGNILANVIKSNYVVSPHYDARGGAIHNFGTMGDVKANMIGNYVEATPTTVNPAYASGGALSNTGTMGKVTGTYKDNHVKTENGNPASQASFARGGAIYNTGTIDGIVNSSFLSNYTEAKDGTAQGGAVWTSKDLDITADNGTSVFKGNYTKTDGEKDDNAIYVGNAEANLNLKQLNNGNMYMYDNIRGEDGYNVNISGDSTGTYYMFNDIYNGNVTMANTTINTVNNKIHTYDFKSLSVNGNTDFVADVDMANQTMDRFTASAYGNHSGKLNVKDMNFISGSDKNKIEIYFAQKGLKDYVTTSKKEFLTPLYKYGIHYDNRDDAGYFVFTRGAGSSNPSDGFNPAVLTSPVATQAGAQSTMTNALYYAFEHGDTFMNFSAMDRFAKINSNTYALAERQGALSTDFNSNLNLDYVHQNKAVWTKPYSSFESIHLKNGPKVDVISYGTLIGFDSNIHKLKRGWSNVATAYIGYNGSQVDYSNVDASTNGGLLGLTETFYKGNFWTALTATAGASFAEAHTMYGKDEMTMLMAGIGSKTGYNFEFKEGKFIIQPRLFMSYSFVNTFDYTNSAGVRIDSDPMHTVQINPSVKFIGNIKGWQPYASVGMVWNLLNETHTEANGVKLPEMHTKPYVEYGVGLQRTWADKFSAYGQAMLRHGGRNGVALTFGFRWALGKDKTQKVQKDSKMLGRQEVKRASKTLSHQNETATEGNRKVLKQLSPTQKQKLANTTTIVNNISPQKAHLEHTTHTAMKANVEKL